MKLRTISITLIIFFLNSNSFARSSCKNKKIITENFKFESVINNDTIYEISLDQCTKSKTLGSVAGSGILISYDIWSTGIGGIEGKRKILDGKGVPTLFIIQRMIGLKEYKSDEERNTVSKDVIKILKKATDLALEHGLDDENNNLKKLKEILPAIPIDGLHKGFYIPVDVSSLIPLNEYINSINLTDPKYSITLFQRINKNRRFNRSLERSVADLLFKGHMADWKDRNTFTIQHCADQVKANVADIIKFKEKSGKCFRVLSKSEREGTSFTCKALDLKCSGGINRINRYGKLIETYIMNNEANLNKCIEDLKN